MKSQPVGMAFHQLPATFQSYWESSKGWVISENCDNQMTISTAASLFSYAFGIFEGMKAYKTQQGWSVFRLLDHAKRFRQSASALQMQEVPVDFFVEGIKTFFSNNASALEDEDVVYFRPLLLADNPQISLAPPGSYRFLVIGTIAGSYGVAGDAIRLQVIDTGRVVPGGIGAVKTCANYAVSLTHRFGANRAAEFTDVLYLDAHHRRRVCETSTSNVFFIFADNRVVTPKLNDEILAGITRDSILQLAPSVLGCSIFEEDIDIDEVATSAVGMFMSGTARTIQTVNSLTYNGSEREFQEHAIAQRLLSALQECQRGNSEFSEWCFLV